MTSGSRTSPDLPTTRRIAALYGDGTIRLIQQDSPALRPGTVAVEVRATLISPGTELRGWRTFSNRRGAGHPPGDGTLFGYSNSGVVLAVGDGVTEFKAGDRIASIGGGYAQHTDYAVVPQRLCVALPDSVTFEQGAYAMLTATALHAVRRCEPQFGEYIAIAGLGIVGQLCAQLLQRNGCYVIGWDILPFQIERAAAWGIDATAAVGNEAEVEATRAFTRGAGLDAGFVAYGGDASATAQSLAKAMKQSPDGHAYGRIIIVGGASFATSDHESAGLTNLDIRRASRTGPGYHDDAWEHGAPYPDTLVRWTTRSNLELCMRLIAEEKLNVDVLTTHTVPFDRLEKDLDAILDEPDRAMGVVLIP